MFDLLSVRITFLKANLIGIADIAVLIESKISNLLISV